MRSPEQSPRAKRPRAAGSGGGAFVGSKDAPAEGVGGGAAAENVEGDAVRDGAANRARQDAAADVAAVQPQRVLAAREVAQAAPAQPARDDAREAQDRLREVREVADEGVGVAVGMRVGVEGGDDEGTERDGAGGGGRSGHGVEVADGRGRDGEEELLEEGVCRITLMLSPELLCLDELLEGLAERLGSERVLGGGTCPDRVGGGGVSRRESAANVATEINGDRARGDGDGDGDGDRRPGLGEDDDAQRVFVTILSRKDGAAALDAIAAVQAEAKAAKHARERVLRSAVSSYAAGVVSAAARMTVPSFVDVAYREPDNAAPPCEADAWRVYLLRKGDAFSEDNGVVSLARQRFYLFGRDRAVSHVFMAHPSCSKQHAVVQFRRISVRRYLDCRGAWRPGGASVLGKRRRKSGDEDAGMIVVPHVLDLQSRNGTFVNGHRIPQDTFVPLRSGDSLAFGASPHDWVFVQEGEAYGHST